MAKHDTRLTASARFSRFLQSNRSLFLVIIIAVGVALVGFVAYSEIHKARLDRSLSLVEQAQSDFDNWKSASDAKKPDLEKPLLQSLAGIIKNYPRLYSAQRALFLRGSFYYEKKDWKQAQSNFATLAKRFPTSYLAAVSLIDAGAASENGNDMTTATSDYQKVADMKGSDVSEKPLAILSLGRIAEQQKSYTDAKKYYDQLVNDYPSSDWTNLARDRIISLQVAGLIPMPSQTGASGSAQGSTTPPAAVGQSSGK